MAWSISNLEKGFSITKALHESSFARHFIDASRSYFPMEGDSIAVYCGKGRTFINQTQCEETYLLTSASNEDSDQTARMRSLIRVFVVRTKKLWLSKNAPSQDYDQTARMYMY